MECDEEREGYVDQPRVAYPAIHSRGGERPHRPHTRAEEGLGAFIASLGAVWAVFETVVQGVNPWHFHLVPPGPPEICTLGILIWLHAKWRHAKAA